MEALRGKGGFGRLSRRQDEAPGNRVRSEAVRGTAKVVARLVGVNEGDSVQNRWYMLALTVIAALAIVSGISEVTTQRAKAGAVAWDDR